MSARRERSKGARRAATKARAALAVVLIGLSGAGLVFGQENDPCREAYLESGLTVQQMGFSEFRELYADTSCAPGKDGPVATRGSGTSGGTR